MAFTTACSKNAFDHGASANPAIHGEVGETNLCGAKGSPTWWRGGAGRLAEVTHCFRLWLLALLFVPAVAWSAEIEVANPQLVAGDEGYVVSADFKFELNPRLEEAVAKGVVLYFVADFELTRARWYWLDEKLASRSQTYRLSYHALTRQYRLSAGSGLHQSFSSLSDAVQVLSRLRNWVVIDRGDKGVRAGDTYDAALRLRLDVTQLPRPFQITALGNKDWSLASDWRIWQTSLPALAPVAAPVSAPVPADAK